MQRIDENTYIDDTLVTCAEYQLFIDEMREQGKYYQPDHWTSNQFPNGQAREPILGVRQSDAIAFCNWLRKAETREWKFRLPTLQETDDFPMNSIMEMTMGYWCGENYQFVWIGHVPESKESKDGILIVQAGAGIVYLNGRVRDWFHLRKKEQPTLERMIRRRVRPEDDFLSLCSTERNIRFSLSGELVEGVSCRLPNSTEGMLVAMRSVELTHDFPPHVYFHVLDLDITHVRVRTFNIELAHNLELAHDRNLELALDRTSIIKLESHLDLGVTLDFARRGTLDFDLVMSFVRNRSDAPATASDLRSYIDIYILQERIAGRSPAFEGIRLVKERIK